jgi:hypothetical protein
MPTLGEGQSDGFSAESPRDPSARRETSFVAAWTTPDCGLTLAPMSKCLGNSSPTPGHAIPPTGRIEMDPPVPDHLVQ